MDEPRRPTASAQGGADAAVELARRLEVDLEDRTLLDRALTHRSWAFENGSVEQNERLEFLGDAVLGLVVTDEIFHAHPEEQEGRLAKVRAAAVKTESLAQVARRIGLGDLVKLGRGESASGGSDKDSILADTLEAVLGAVYVDQGFATAYDLVQRLFGEVLTALADRGAALDYKTSLQELAAAHYEVVPRYEVTDVGPDHDKTFTATVSVAEEFVGQGTGRSKKQAEQRAARAAYRQLSDREQTDREQTGQQQADQEPTDQEPTEQEQAT